MALDTAKVTTRSNSDLSRVDLVLMDLGSDRVARMEAILAIALEWDRATAGSVGRVGARTKAAERYPYVLFKD